MSVNELLLHLLFDDNYVFSDNGKIWVLWHPSLSIKILSKSLQLISCEVELPDYSVFVASIAYASNCPDQRKELWKSLVSFGNSPSVVGKPWIFLDVFNQTLDPNEHSACQRPKATKLTKEPVYSESASSRRICLT